jgi:Trp operon repressor
MEQWQDVAGFEGILQVSDNARIKSMARLTTGVRNGAPIAQRRPETIMSPWIGNNGYLHVSPQIGGLRPKLLVHRLVAIAFVEGFRDGFSVNHINGVKTDNRPQNLEWVSLARNTQMQWDAGLVDLRGERNPMAKLTARKVRIIRGLLAKGASCNELAELAGVSASCITLIRNGDRWQSVVARSEAE